MTHGFARWAFTGVSSSPTSWVRPADWLALTTPSTSDQRMVGLAAVFESNSNFVTVYSTAAFKVDWGDGAGWQLFAANTTAEKNLQWADYGAGTLCTRGYRQAVITVEPQSGNLTGLQLHRRHSNATANTGTSSVWLDLRMSVTDTPTITGAATQWYPQMLETIDIVSNVSSAAYLFIGCNVLFAASVDTSGVTNFSNMFRNCYSLQQIPVLSTSAGSDFSSMFQSCYSLQQVPALDTSSGTNFTTMFQYCYSLQQVPALDTSSGTNFTSMFQYCYSLQRVPALNTSSGTNFTSMFQYCYVLQYVPQLFTSSGTNFTSMFHSCAALQEAPPMDVSAGTNFSTMFQNCYSLRWSGIYGGRYAISYATNNLSAAALDNIYTNLGTASGAQTITVTGNWGTSGHTPSIATAKSWTVAA